MQRQQAVISVVVAMAVSLGLLVTGVLAQSGSLEPPGSAVDGVGDPVPTTQTQPSWDQSLPAAERFVLVMGGAAVLDKNTGLVLEQSPRTTKHTWSDARDQCARRGTGGQMGWRLPSSHELASLVDPGDPVGSPDLPAGHLFSNVRSSTFWAAATDADNSAKAWAVNFGFGNVGTIGKVLTIFVWCVRGGSPGPGVY